MKNRSTIQPITQPRHAARAPRAGVDRQTRRIIERRTVNTTTQRLARINIAGGFTFDARGNMLTKDPAGTINDLGFSFDRANRLLEVKRNNVLQSVYRYDANGHRTKTITPSSGDFRYQVYSQSGQFLWDANFDKDQANHLVHQTTDDYIHLQGRLIAKRESVSSVPTDEDRLPLFEDGFETLLRTPEASNAAPITAKDLHANPFEPNAVAAISVQYVHVDALGSPIAESDSAGNLIGSRSYYDPYGQPLTTPTEGQPNCTGHQFDSSTGLIQAQKRFYDPMTCRFISTDPVSVDLDSARNFSRYAYAANMPYKMIDPDGGENRIFTDGTVKKDIITAIERGSMTQVNAVVLHRTAGSTAESAISQWKKGGAGTHFIIDKDGTITQTANVTQKTDHVGKIKSRCAAEGSCTAGKWEPTGTHRTESKKAYPDRYPTNADSIGIEVVGAFDKTTSKYDTPTTEQIDSVSTLVEALKSDEGLDDDDIYKHGDVSNKEPAEGEELGYD